MQLKLYHLKPTVVDSLTGWKPTQRGGSLSSCNPEMLQKQEKGEDCESPREVRPIGLAVGQGAKCPMGKCPACAHPLDCTPPCRSMPTLLMAQPRGARCQPFGHTQVSEMKAYYPRFRQLHRCWGSSPAHSSSSHRQLQWRENQSEEGSVGADSRGCLRGKNGGPTTDCPLWDCCPGACPLHASAPAASHRGKELIARLLTPGWTDTFIVK